MNRDDFDRILTEFVLPFVEKPGGYIGGETNSVVKDPAEVSLRVALAFPDAYAIGMSHAGLQILYGVLNALEGVACERVFAPWVDMRARLAAHGLPLFTLETRTPLADCHVVAFSLQYEMSYTTVLAMLDAAGIPLRRDERGEHDPLVIAGGPCAFNPEPMADFIDLFLVGDGEESIASFARLVQRLRGEGAKRQEMVAAVAAALPCAYAPGLYSVAFHDDGTVAAVAPAGPNVPWPVERAVVVDLDQAFYPTRPVVPYVEVVHDRITLEIMRGCTRGCRFCQAGMIKRPVRIRTIERLMDLAEASYRHTGHNEISLVSLSSSDYPDFEELVKRMSRAFNDRCVNIALPSLRVDEHLVHLPQYVSSVRKSGLTIAPEAAREGLRCAINKDIRDEDLLRGVRSAFAAGWQAVKLYFMVGLPGETAEDVTAIPDLAAAVSDARRDVAAGPAQVNVAVAPFVPKPHTPFQWHAMPPPAYFDEVRERLHGLVRRRAVRIKFHDVRRSYLEAVFSRGDRRLGRVIEGAYRAGAVFDAWDEFFDFDRWLAAFEAVGLDPDFYALRPRDLDEVLPWDHIFAGVEKAFLVRELKRAHQQQPTPDCRDGRCQACGAQVEGACPDADR